MLLSECLFYFPINDAELSPVYSADAASGYTVDAIYPGS